MSKIRYGSSTAALRAVGARWLQYTLVMAATSGALCGLALTADAAQPVADAQVTLTPLPTPGATLDVPANPASTAFYDFSINDGDTFNKTITVQACSSNHQNNWTSYTIGDNNAAGPLGPSISVAPVTFGLLSPGCQNLVITINAGTVNLTDPNTAQVFNGQVNINKLSSVPSAPPVQVTILGRSVIHIRVNVFPAQQNVLCYMTDSEGNFLLDGGAPPQPVSESGSEDGVFSIVVNKKTKKEVATNPGQFYFNLVWWNRATTNKRVYADMRNPAPTNLVTHGTNAVHSGLFAGNSPFDTNEFTCTNDGSSTCSSTPWGNSGRTQTLVTPPSTFDPNSGVPVPDNQTLVVTEHLEWKWIGSAAPQGCTNVDGSCPISVTGVLYDTLNDGDASNDQKIGECKAGATGFLKY